MQTDEILASWTELLSGRSVAKRYFDTSHPLDLLYGGDSHGRAMLIAIMEAKPRLPVISAEIDLELAVRETDNRWAMSMTLNDATLTVPFQRLCVDLAARSNEGRSTDQAMDLLLDALTQWQALLRPFRPARLSLEELRGLVAELWFGYRILVKSHSAEEVTDGWKGPKGAPQDFEFLDNTSYEVKSRRPGRDVIRIASAEQLDAPHKELRLAVVVLDECDPSTPESTTLPDLVERARDMVSPAKRADISDRIREMRVDLADEYYAQHHFRVIDLEIFSVDDNFPALRASRLPHAVTDVSYALHTGLLKRPCDHPASDNPTEPT